MPDQVVTQEEIVTLLNRLADAQDQLNSATAECETLLQEALTPEVKEKQAAAHARYDPLLATLTRQVAQAKEEIVAKTKGLGTKAVGERLQAIYTPPKPVWNTDKLEGLALVYPAILAAKAMSEPSVSIRPFTKKKGEE